MARKPATKSTTAGKRPASRTPKADPAPGAGAAPAAASLKARPKTAVKDEAPAAPKRLSLPGVGAASTRIRTVLLNFAFVAAFLVLVPVIVSQFWRTEVLIDRIPVPTALADIGLTPDVAASRLWDGLRDATALGSSSKESISAIPDSQRVQFTLPESGFSMESLIQQTRQFFHAYQTRIGGEFTCGDPACTREGIRLRMRVVTDKARVYDLPPLGDTPLREYFTQAGVQALSALDPVVAIDAIAETQPIRAMVLARNLIRERHEDAEWAYNLIGQMQADRPEDAIAAFREALAINPKLVIARSNLASTLTLLGRYDEARAEYAILARDAPDHPRVLQGQADLAIKEQRYDDAEKILERAGRLHARDPVFRFFMGDVWRGRGNVEFARAEYERALNLDPEFTLALGALAQSYFDAGDFDSADPYFARLVAYDPRNLEALALYADALSINDLQRAYDLLLEAEVVDPNSIPVLTRLADITLRGGLVEDSIGYHRRVVALDPANVAALTGLGDALMQTLANAEAATVFAQALELAPDDVTLLARAAMNAAYTRDYVEAIRLIQHAVDVDPANPGNLFDLASYHKYAGHKDEALAGFRHYLEIAPDDAIFAAHRKLATDSIAELEAAVAPVSAP